MYAISTELNAFHVAFLQHSQQILVIGNTYGFTVSFYIFDSTAEIAPRCATAEENCLSFLLSHRVVES